jgi:hypothetical protein
MSQPSQFAIWSCRLRSCVAVILALALTSPAFAQVATTWQPPPSTLDVDLSPKNKDRRIVFLDDGAAIEVVVNFLMLREPQVSLTAPIPEPGRFAVELANPKSLVEVKDVRRDPDAGAAEIVSKVPNVDPAELAQQARDALDKVLAPARKRLGPDAAKASKMAMKQYLIKDGEPPDNDDELREAYLRARAMEGSADVLRDKLAEIAKRRNRWFTPEEKEYWDKAKGRELGKLYQELLEIELSEEVLRKCGLEFDSSSRNFAKNLKPMLRAVNVIVTGRLADDKAAGKLVADALSNEQLNQLRQSLGVSLKCRFYPEADAADGNAQWFAAQRVACRASGVSVIRVEGQLDPKKSDRVDWWRLEHYDPEAVKLVTSQGDARFDPPFVQEGAALLRVIATGDEPASYWFELRSDRPGALKVQVHESPAAGEAKFPY